MILDMNSRVRMSELVLALGKIVLQSIYFPLIPVYHSLRNLLSKVVV